MYPICVQRGSPWPHFSMAHQLTAQVKVIDVTSTGTVAGEDLT